MLSGFGIVKMSRREAASISMADLLVRGSDWMDSPKIPSTRDATSTSI
jgi:hypothetical protein